MDLAEVGFPVAEVTVHHWANWVAALREEDGNLLIGGHEPKSCPGPNPDGSVSLILII